MSDRPSAAPAGATAVPATVLRDSPGASWEKRGNTVWVECPGCGGWFPVSPVMVRPEATPACCPHCHYEFKVAAVSPR